jgi:hypothetical protein
MFMGLPFAGGLWNLQFKAAGNPTISPAHSHTGIARTGKVLPLAIAIVERSGCNAGAVGGFFFHAPTVLFAPKKRITNGCEINFQFREVSKWTA